jgi:NAD(P)H-dependent FMN reductase
MLRIKVIIGSTRPNRFGIQPANWITELAAGTPDAQFELVDLAEVNLPFLDEPQPPAAGNYVNEHTKAWSKIISEADGFIFVTPEYNHGVPASLKNAIDFLADEWRYKPVAFISYGAEAGGTRAVEHFRSSLAWLDMYDLKYQVVIPNYWSALDENGRWQPTEQQVEAGKSMIEKVTFWAKQFQNARQELSK